MVLGLGPSDPPPCEWSWELDPLLAYGMLQRLACGRLQSILPPRGLLLPASAAVVAGCKAYPDLRTYDSPNWRIVTSGQQHGVRIYVTQSASALWPGLLAGWKACIRPISCKVLANGVRAA